MSLPPCLAPAAAFSWTVCDLHRRRAATRGGPGTARDAPGRRYYLSDHRKAHDEKRDAAPESEQGLVCTQVLGELVRNGGHDSLDGGKLRNKTKGFISVPTKHTKGSGWTGWNTREYLESWVFNAQMLMPKLHRDDFSIDGFTSFLCSESGSLTSWKIATNLQTNKQEKKGKQKPFTIVSSPSVRSIKKNIIAQNGERGSLVKASG